MYKKKHVGFTLKDAAAIARLAIRIYDGMSWFLELWF